MESGSVRRRKRSIYSQGGLSSTDESSTAEGEKLECETVARLGKLNEVGNFVAPKNTDRCIGPWLSRSCSSKLGALIHMCEWQPSGHCIHRKQKEALFSPQVRDRIPRSSCFRSDFASILLLYSSFIPTRRTREQGLDLQTASSSMTRTVFVVRPPQ